MYTYCVSVGGDNPRSIPADTLIAAIRIYIKESLREGDDDKAVEGYRELPALLRNQAI